MTPRAPPTFGDPPMTYGAHLTGTGCRFRVWAPDHAAVSVVIDGQRHPLWRDADGTHFGEVAGHRRRRTLWFRLRR